MKIKLAPGETVTVSFKGNDGTTKTAKKHKRVSDEERVSKTLRVSDEDLLKTFERMCTSLGVLSRGFHPEDITAPIDGARYDGTKQWAIHHNQKGWMVVCGSGGCGAALSRWNGYVRERWDFLLLLEAVEIASKKSPGLKAGVSATEDR